MRVLVTGHRGYVGSHLVPLLAARGHEVHGLDARLFEGCDFGAPPAEPGHTREADVRDHDWPLPPDLDAVIHLAALSNDPLGDFDPALTHAINAEAAVALAERARSAGVRRFLFASSCSIYGAGRDGFLDERTPPRPLTPYAEAKAEAERRIAALADEHFSPTFLRPGTAYGASPRLRGDLVVNNLVAYALLDQEVLIKSDGRPWRPLVHVADVARAFGALLEAPATLVHGEAFNIGATADNFRVAALADAVAAAVPGSRIRYAADAGPDRRTYRVSCDKLAAAVPAARPRWDLERGIADLVAAFRARALDRGEFFGPRFFRLECVRRQIARGELSGALRRPVHAAGGTGSRALRGTVL